MRDRRWKPDRIIFIGTYAGKQYFDKLVSEKKYIQLAANQTEGYYIEELSNLQVPIYVLSSLVTNGSPKKDLIVKSNVENEKNYIINNVGFFNIPYLSVISQTISLKHETKVIARNKNWDNTLIIVYSMRVPYLEAAKKIKDEFPTSRVIIIVPDLPAFMRGGNDPMIRKMLSGLNDSRLLKLRKAVDGYVLYSRHMSNYLKLRDDEWIVIEGLYVGSKGTDKNDKEKQYNKQRFIYAGGIEESYGVKNLVEGFLMANLKDAELCFYGAGSYSTHIEEIQKSNPRIKYCGLVPPDEMKKIMLSADALVNPRPSESDFTKYSCPSKVIEYMATGVPVIMTKLEGIPEEYFNYVYTISKPGAEGIAEALISFNNTSENDRKELGIRARSFIIENKNARKQIARMLLFAEEI